MDTTWLTLTPKMQKWLCNVEETIWGWIQVTLVLWNLSAQAEHSLDDSIWECSDFDQSFCVLRMNAKKERVYALFIWVNSHHLPSQQAVQNYNVFQYTMTPKKIPDHTKWPVTWAYSPGHMEPPHLELQRRSTPRLMCAGILTGCLVPCHQPFAGKAAKGLLPLSLGSSLSDSSYPSLSLLQICICTQHFCVSRVSTLVLRVPSTAPTDLGLKQTSLSTPASLTLSHCITWMLLHHGKVSVWPESVSLQ